MNNIHIPAESNSFDKLYLKAVYIQLAKCSMQNYKYECDYFGVTIFL